MLPQVIKLLNFLGCFCRRKLSQHGPFLVMLVVESLIVLPCSLEPLPCSAGEVVFEVPHSNLVRAEEVSEKFMGRMVSLVKIEQDVIKGVSEFRGLFVKGDGFMNFSVPVFGKEVTDDERNKCSEECSECIFAYAKKHWSFLLGLITGPLWYLFFRFMFRRITPKVSGVAAVCHVRFRAWLCGFSLFICKGEKMFNYILKFFSVVIGRFYIHAFRIIHPKSLVCSVLSAILIIFAYSLVEIGFASDKISKLGAGAIDSGDRVAQPMNLFLLPILVNGVEADKLIKNGCLKFGGGNKEFLSLHDSNGVIIGRFYSFDRSSFTDNSTKPNTNQSTNYTDQGSDNITVHKEPLNVKMIVYQIIGTIIGLILGGFLVYFTQHEVHREAKRPISPIRWNASFDGTLPTPMEVQPLAL